MPFSATPANRGTAKTTTLPDLVAVEGCLGTHDVELVAELLQHAYGPDDLRPGRAAAASVHYNGDFGTGPATAHIRLQSSRWV